MKVSEFHRANFLKQISDLYWLLQQNRLEYAQYCGFLAEAVAKLAELEEW